MAEIGYEPSECRSTEERTFLVQNIQNVSEKMAPGCVLDASSNQEVEIKNLMKRSKEYIDDILNVKRFNAFEERWIDE